MEKLLAKKLSEIASELDFGLITLSEALEKVRKCHIWCTKWQFVVPAFKNKYIKELENV